MFSLGFLFFFFARFKLFSRVFEGWRQGLLFRVSGNPGTMMALSS